MAVMAVASDVQSSFPMDWGDEPDLGVQPDELADLDDAVSKAEEKLAKVDVPIPINFAEADRLVEEAKDLQSEVATLKPRYDDALTRAEEKKAKSSPAESAAIDDRMSDLSARWNALDNAVDATVPKLEAAAAKAKEFDAAANEFEPWILGRLQVVKSPLLLRAIPDGVRAQIDEHKKFGDEVEATKPAFENLVRLEEDLTAVCSADDAGVLDEHVGRLRAQWDDLIGFCAEREHALDDGLQQAEKFAATWKSTVDAIDAKTDEVKAMKPIGHDREAVSKQLEDIGDFIDSLEPIRANITTLGGDGQHLIDTCDKQDSPVIEEQLSKLRGRWEFLIGFAKDRNHSLEDAMVQLGQFKDMVGGLLAWLAEAESSLHAAEQKPMAVEPKKIKAELVKTQDLEKDVNDHEGRVKSANDVADQLRQGGGDDDDEMSAELGTVNQRYGALRMGAADQVERIRKALVVAEEYDAGSRAVLDSLRDLEASSDAKETPGGLPETCRSQEARRAIVGERIEELGPRVENVLALVIVLKAHVSPPDAERLELATSEMKRRLKELQTNAEKRRGELADALETAEDFQTGVASTFVWLADLEDKLKSADAIGSEVEYVREQLEKHREFQQLLGPHQADVDGINDEGIGIVKVCLVRDRPRISEQLAEINQRWADLCQNSVARQQKLEEALLAAGQYQAAFDGLLGWVAEAEKTLAEAEPTTGDVEKLKLLLGKHKAFQKTVNGRQPTYESVVKAGRVLLSSASPEDAPALKSSLDDLVGRWKALAASVDARGKRLDDARRHAARFQATIKPLLVWIAQVVPTVKAGQPIYGDVKTVAVLRTKHGALEKEMENRQKDVDGALALGRQLGSDVFDDSTDVDVELEQLESQWAHLKDSSVAHGDDLATATTVAQEFESEYGSLMKNLVDMEVELSQAGPISETDLAKVEREEAKHRDFETRLESMRGRYENVKANGARILERCYPKAVRTIHTRLGELETRWLALRDKSTGRQRSIDDSLILLRGLQAAVDEMTAWLTGAEVRVKGFEDFVVPAEHGEIERVILEIETFQKEMGQYQPKMAALMKYLSSPRKRGSLGRIEAGKNYQAAITGLNRRWKALWLRLLQRLQFLQAELEKAKVARIATDFDFDAWRKRFVEWMDAKKVRIIDIFRKFDANGDGQLSHDEFVEGISRTRFKSHRAELKKVAAIFDPKGIGYVDYKAFASQLRPHRVQQLPQKPQSDSQKIEAEINRVTSSVTFAFGKEFKYTQVGDGRYRFGDSQKIYMIRILRSTIMVRVGGGWMKLEEFLMHYDPAKVAGRTNLELRSMLREQHKHVGVHTMGARSKQQSTLAAKNRDTLAAAAKDRDADVTTRTLASGRTETVVTKRKEYVVGEATPHVVEGVEHSGQLSRSMKVRKQVGATKTTTTTTHTVVRHPVVERKTIVMHEKSASKSPEAEGGRVVERKVVRRVVGSPTTAEGKTVVQHKGLVKKTIVRESSPVEIGGSRKTVVKRTGPVVKTIIRKEEASDDDEEDSAANGSAASATVTKTTTRGKVTTTTTTTKKSTGPPKSHLPIRSPGKGSKPEKAKSP